MQLQKRDLIRDNSISLFEKTKGPFKNDVTEKLVFLPEPPLPLSLFVICYWYFKRRSTLVTSQKVKEVFPDKQLAKVYSGSI